MTVTVKKLKKSSAKKREDPSAGRRLAGDEAGGFRVNAKSESIVREETGRKRTKPGERERREKREKRASARVSSVNEDSSIGVHGSPSRRDAQTRRRSQKKNVVCVFPYFLEDDV